MSRVAPVVGRVSSPAELASAVPYLLGFHPRDSLVVVTIQPGSPHMIGLTLRTDLPPPGEESALVNDLAVPLLASRPHAVILVVVCDRHSPRDDGPPGRAAVTAARAALGNLGIAVAHAMWVAATEAGARWMCFDDPDCAGVLPDPRETALAAATTAAGMVTFADREELQRLVAPDDDEALQRRAALLDAAVEAAELGGRSDSSAATRRGRRLVRDAVRAAGQGRFPTDDRELVALAVALCDPLVRDWCLTMCLADSAHAAEQLWLALTRATPPPEVAEPAALAALAAYLRGDGALAGLALERAHDAWPGHNLSTLLRFALQTAVPPERLEQFIADAEADADLALDDDDDDD
jgi:hypothetical protein